MVQNTPVLDFVIKDFTPDTLPMERLAKYLLDLAVMLGEPEHVHFEKLVPGSTKVRHRIDPVASLKVERHVAEARVAGSKSPHRRAFEALDAKLREDGTSGELLRVDGENKPGQLLVFPGSRRSAGAQQDPVFGPFSEQGSIQGRIIGVGGRSQYANVNIQQGSDIHYCEATRDVATELAPLIYRVDVRVYGTGRYTRTPDGEWVMDRFRISTFEKLNQLAFSDVVERLRDITRKVGLDRDIIQKLAELRSDPSEA